MHVARRVCIHHREQRYLLTLLLQLAGHLEGDGAPKRKPSQQIWTNRLQHADRFDILRRHLLDRDFFLDLQERLGWYSVEGPLLAHVLGQFIKAEHLSTNCMHAEKRRLRTKRLNRYQRCPRLRSLFLIQRFSQILDCRSLEQRGEW